MRASFPVIGSIHFDAESRDEVELIVQEIVLEGAYLGPPIALSPGAVVFDVGANIGVFVRFVHHRLGGDCRIFAFEPAPSTFQHLTENAGHAAALFPVALGRAPARRTLTVFPALPGNSTLRPEEKRRELELARARSIAATLAPFRPMVERRFEELLSSHEVECQVVDLSSVVEAEGTERIDLLKIDVEGAEREVLEGIDEKTWPKIRQVALEAGDGAAAAALAEDLRRAGFRVEGHRPAWAERLGLDNRELRAVR